MQGPRQQALVNLCISLKGHNQYDSTFYPLFTKSQHNIVVMIGKSSKGENRSFEVVRF